MKTLKAILGLVSIPFWALGYLLYTVFIAIIHDVIPSLEVLGDKTLKKLRMSK